MRLEQDPIHRHKDVLAHTIAVVAKTRPERIVRLAALLHDVGKPKTRSIGPDGVSFHHHEVVGARMARDRMRALQVPQRRRSRRSAGSSTCTCGSTPTRWAGPTAPSDGSCATPAPLLPELIELTRCDCTTRNERKARQLSSRMDELEARIAELAEARRSWPSLRPDLDGRQVMDHLGIEPGRVVGQALDFLLELRLDEGPLGEDEAYRRLDAWWAEQPH